MTILRQSASETKMALLWSVDVKVAPLRLCFYLLFSCVVLRILLCPLSGPELIYISLLIIFCINKYVTNKIT